MAIKKDLKKIVASQNEIISYLKGEYLEKAKKYDQIKEWLANINIKMKSVESFNDYGEPIIKVEYSLKPLILEFDENNEILKNETFVAINNLNLVDFESMQKISEQINLIKRRKK